MYGNEDVFLQRLLDKYEILGFEDCILYNAALYPVSGTSTLKYVNIHLLGLLSGSKIHMKNNCKM